MTNKEIKKNTVNSNFYEGTDDKGCHFSFSQNDTGTEEDKRYWNEQVSWHAKQVGEHANQVPHSRTISFTHRRKEGDKIVENTRVFEVPVNGKNSSARISEIDEHNNENKAIDDGRTKENSNKRQQTDNKENSSVKKSKGENRHNNQSSSKGKSKQSEVKGGENKNSQESNNSKISSVETNDCKEEVVSPNNSSVSDSSSKVSFLAVFATFCSLLAGGIVGIRK